MLQNRIEFIVEILLSLSLSLSYFPDERFISIDANQVKCGELVMDSEVEPYRAWINKRNDINHERNDSEKTQLNREFPGVGSKSCIPSADVRQIYANEVRWTRLIPHSGIFGWNRPDVINYHNPWIMSDGWVGGGGGEGRGWKSIPIHANLCKCGWIAHDIIQFEVAVVRTRESGYATRRVSRLASVAQPGLGNRPRRFSLFIFCLAFLSFFFSFHFLSFFLFFFILSGSFFLFLFSCCLVLFRRLWHCQNGADGQHFPRLLPFLGAFLAPIKTGGPLVCLRFGCGFSWVPSRFNSFGLRFRTPCSFCTTRAISCRNVGFSLPTVSLRFHCGFIAVWHGTAMCGFCVQTRCISSAWLIQSEIFKRPKKKRKVIQKRDKRSEKNIGFWESNRFQFACGSVSVSFQFHFGFVLAGCGWFNQALECRCVFTCSVHLIYSTGLTPF